MLNKNQEEWSSCSTLAQNTKHSEILRKEKKSFLKGNKLFFDELFEYDLNNKQLDENLLSAKGIDNNKSRLRTLLLSKRKKLSENEIKIRSNIIADTLFSLEIYKKSQNIALYHPINGEVCTNIIFNKSVLDGKKLYFPKVLGSFLEFYLVNDFSDLEPGFKDIPEPGAEATKINKDDLDLILIPGLGFDKFGNRLGYGGGFFDKYLEDLPKHKSVALAFDLQVLDCLPARKHDMKVGRIITESKAINCLGLKGGLQCKP